MNGRIKQYVTLVTLAAIAAGIALFLRDPTFPAAFIRAAVTFGLISTLAQALRYRTASEAASGSLSFIPVLASAAIAPHWVSVVSVTLASLAAQALAQKTFLKTVFNSAQNALSLALAIVAYLATGGQPLRHIGESSSLSLFALFLVFFLTNSVCVSGVIGIANGKNAWMVWKENTL